MHSLPVFLRLCGAPVILVGEGATAGAKRRLIERAGAIVVGEESEARIAFVALAAGAEAAAARLKARGLLINVADRPELCDFTLPAIVDRDPVVVAIGTGGVSAGLAAALRQRLEAFLPESLGALATALHATRPELAARFPDPEARRRALATLLAPGAALDPLVPVPDVPAALAAAETALSRIERLAITSPDPDELTLRAARLLGHADRLYHPLDIPPAILDRARADATRIVGLAPASPPPGLSLELAWTPVSTLDAADPKESDMAEQPDTTTGAPLVNIAPPPPRETIPDVGKRPHRDGIDEIARDTAVRGAEEG